MCADLVTREVFLQPGHHFVGDALWRMRTLLGSCVSITLWHPRMRVGAMSHFLLSTRGMPASAEPDGRYGDESLQLMLSELKRQRVPIVECEAKIFGGGNMFPNQSCKCRVNVGQANGEAARAMLLAHGIPVRSESLFGVGHRQIIFDVATGHVWARQVAPNDVAMFRQEFQ
ncbi:MAG: chemotaxis protein CheD [Burkholderiales bacterium]|nr:chemotaxis protein CheD [Burkholderiales bacterium]